MTIPGIRGRHLHGEPPYQAPNCLQTTVSNTLISDGELIRRPLSLCSPVFELPSVILHVHMCFTYGGGDPITWCSRQSSLAKAVINFGYSVPKTSHKYYAAAAVAGALSFAWFFTASTVKDSTWMHDCREHRNEFPATCGRCVRFLSSVST